MALGTELPVYQAPLSLIHNPLPPFKILYEGLFVKQGIIKLPRSGAVPCLRNSSTYSYRTEPPGPATGQRETCIFSWDPPSRTSCWACSGRSTSPNGLDLSLGYPEASVLLPGQHLQALQLTLVWMNAEESGPRPRLGNFSEFCLSPDLSADATCTCSGLQDPLWPPSPPRICFPPV